MTRSALLSGLALLAWGCGDGGAEPACAAYELSCANGIDDDCNGLRDCDDPQCDAIVVCLPPGTEPDAGRRPDAGRSAPRDAGAMVRDADPALSDTGPPAADGGGSRLDAGTVAADAGPLARDAGPRPADAGPPPRDAGPPPDAYVCRPAGTEADHCDDGIDNDCNSLVDCADGRCYTAPVCACAVGFPLERYCADGFDDDCDGTMDCADRDCRYDLACR